MVSGLRRIGGAGVYPSVRSGIISTTGIENGVAIRSSPDNHFRAGP